MTARAEWRLFMAVLAMQWLILAAVVATRLTWFFE